jgi:predicted phage terminase large subunit-like protein
MNHCLILLGAERARWDFSDLRNKIMNLSNRHSVDAILVEQAASGKSIAQELKRSGYPIREYNPDRDKEAKAHASSNMFYNSRIYAPLDKRWAKDVMAECAAFPRGANDDYVDTVTQAVLWVRDNILVIAKDEPWHDEDEEEYRSSRNRRRTYWS